MPEQSVATLRISVKTYSYSTKGEEYSVLVGAKRIGIIRKHKNEKFGKRLPDGCAIWEDNTGEILGVFKNEYAAGIWLAYQNQYFEYISEVEPMLNQFEKEGA